jgi:hypothetical protein
MLTSTVVSLVLTWSCAAEQQRVRTHLEGAYTQLTTEEPAGLTPTQRSRRLQALAVLREYIDRGQFPKNPGLGLTPLFVDEDGTRCAMGEVIARLGGESLVEHVRQTRNLATVGVLADEPGLLEWLSSHGLTPEEAALVQPTYLRCDVERLLSVCGQSDEGFDGGSLVTARVQSDGGVFELERSGGEGKAPPLVFSWRSPEWPAGTVYLWASARFGGRVLVQLGSTFRSRIDGWCGAAPVLTPAEARAVLGLPRQACMRALLQKDPRWALGVNSWINVRGEGTRSWGDFICDEAGALRAEFVGSRECAESWLKVSGFADAGVDLSDYDRWLTERPGPPVLEPITLEAPPALPLHGGCTVLPSTTAAWLIVLLLARRRR